MNSGLVNDILFVIVTSTGTLVGLFFAVFIPTFLKLYEREKELNKQLSDIQNRLNESKQKNALNSYFNLLVDKIVTKITIEELPPVPRRFFYFFLCYSIFVFSSSLLLLAISESSLFKVIKIEWVVYVLTLLAICNFILPIPLTSKILYII